MKNLRTAGIGEDVDEPESLHIWLECKLPQLLWKTLECFLYKFKFPYEPVIPFPNRILNGILKHGLEEPSGHPGS